MRKFIAILLVLATAACGRADKPLIGAWERAADAPNSVSPTQVLEFLDSGVVLLHAPQGELGAAFKGTGTSIEEVKKCMAYMKQALA